MPSKLTLQEAVINALTTVHAYADQTDDWIVIKRELMKHLSIDEQALMSTRDPLTKKQNFNEFEQILVNCWEKLTDRKVDLSKVTKHV